MSGRSMRRPRSGEGSLFWVVATASCALGLVVGGVELGAGSLLICWAFTSVLAMCLVLAVNGPGTPPSTVARRIFLGGVMATGCLGLVTGLGVTGVVWILAVAATSRSARRRARAWWLERRPEAVTDDPTTRAPTMVHADPDLPAEKLRDLDDEALCLAWRRSYVQMQQSPSVSARVHHAQQRQRLLDELERRNPEGLAAWLASGCRAAGNPLPFLARSATPEAMGRGGDRDRPEDDGEERSRRTS
jgi:hypothetical protein